MSPFGNVSSLELQRIWDGVHGRVVHGERITLGVLELDADSVVPEHSHEHEQLGICLAGSLVFRVGDEARELGPGETWSIPGNVPHEVHVGDRKSTRLNSSHTVISYAVFCLKKKKETK